MTSSVVQFTVPDSLQRRMDEALADAGDASDDVSACASAAVQCLRDALARCDERAAALHLLAADALITKACELAAAADDGGMALRALCEQFAAERMRDVLGS